MSAETLRAAAALMRQRAEAATLGHWQAADSWAGSNAVLNEEGYPIAICGNDSPEHGYLRPAADRAHIASWGPAVALAVADWLDEEADSWTDPDDDGIPHFRAHMVAATYLDLGVTA